MLYMKFQASSSSGSLVLQPAKGVTDGQAKTDMPPQLLRSWGIIKKIMRFPNFEPGIHGLKVHQDIHYAMEANAIYR